MTNALKRYVGHKFASTPKGLHEFKRFYLAYIKALKGIAKRNGWMLILHDCDEWLDYFYFSILVRKPETRQLVYIQIPDVRYSPEEWHRKILVREAVSLRYFGIGMIEEYCTYDELEETIKKIFERSTK